MKFHLNDNNIIASPSLVSPATQAQTFILEMRNEIGNNQVKVAVIYVFNHRIMESKKKTHQHFWVFI